MKASAKTILFVACGVLVIFVLWGGIYRKPAPPANLLEKPQVLTLQVEKIVMENLKDPNSAQFRNVKAVLLKNGSEKQGGCGEVNAKNGFGGYNGFKRFLVVDGIGALLDDESERFEQLWRAACTTDPAPSSAATVTSAAVKPVDGCWDDIDGQRRAWEAANPSLAADVHKHWNDANLVYVGMPESAAMIILCHFTETTSVTETHYGKSTQVVLRPGFTPTKYVYVTNGVVTAVQR